jgi:hypothetical protein
VLELLDDAAADYDLQNYVVSRLLTGAELTKALGPRFRRSLDVP